MKNHHRGPRVPSAKQRLAMIEAVIDRVENRCLAVDGPATKTKDEITDAELRQIYKLCQMPKPKPKRMKARPEAANLNEDFDDVTPAQMRALDDGLRGLADAIVKGREQKQPPQSEAEPTGESEQKA